MGDKSFLIQLIILVFLILAGCQQEIGGLPSQIRNQVINISIFDFNNDGKIEIIFLNNSLRGTDGILFIQHFGLTRQSQKWDSSYDLNKDNKINYDDFFILADFLQNTNTNPSGNATERNSILIMVDDRLKQSLKTEIDQFKQDIENDLDLMSM